MHGPQIQAAKQKSQRGVCDYDLPNDHVRRPMNSLHWNIHSLKVGESFESMRVFGFLLTETMKNWATTNMPWNQTKRTLLSRFSIFIRREVRLIKRRKLGPKYLKPERASLWKRLGTIMSTLECYPSVFNEITISLLKRNNIRSILDFLHETPESTGKILKMSFKVSQPDCLPSLIAYRRL